MTGETLKQTTCDFDFPELASASISLLKNSTIACAGRHFRPRPTLTFIMQELQEPIRPQINDISFSGTGVTHVAQTQTGRIWRLALLCIVRNKDLHDGKRLSLQPRERIISSTVAHERERIEIKLGKSGSLKLCVSFLLCGF